MPEMREARAYSCRRYRSEHKAPGLALAGCFGFCACCTFGLILIIPLITNSKTRSRTFTQAVCQTCGHRWRIESRRLKETGEEKAPDTARL